MSNETKHTPGPWQAVEHYSDSVSVVDQSGMGIVEANGVALLLGYAEKLGVNHWADSEKAHRELSDEEQAANAHLIAAAPDLLWNLENCRRHVQECQRNASNALDAGAIGYDLMCLDEAIAKAKGELP